MRANGTGLRRLTYPPTRQDLGGDTGPIWSPDGHRIVFERDLTFWGDDRVRLTFVPARGGIAHDLTRGPFDAMPTFAPGINYCPTQPQALPARRSATWGLWEATCASGPAAGITGRDSGCSA